MPETILIGLIVTIVLVIVAVICTSILLYLQRREAAEVQRRCLAEIREIQMKNGDRFAALLRERR